MEFGEAYNSLKDKDTVTKDERKAIRVEYAGKIQEYRDLMKLIVDSRAIKKSYRELMKKVKLEVIPKV